MKKFSLTAFLCAAILTLNSVACAADLSKVGTPILITALGQSQDANFVNLLAKRKKIDMKYDLHVFAKDVNWADYKTLFIVLGGSGKGLGAAGLDIPGEVKRSDELVAGAKKNGLKIVALHIGGEDRRGPNSDPFIGYAGMADLAIVREDGNVDGYFTKLCESKKIPLLLIKKTSELTDMLVEMTKEL